MIILDRGAVKIGEVWFGGGEGAKGPAAAGGPVSHDSAAFPSLDLIQYVQLDAPREGAKCTPFSTILIDLGQSEDDLLAAMKKDARYAARRAEEKDRPQCLDPSAADASTLHRFQDFYDRFAAQKGLSSLDPAILGAYAQAGALYLSLATSSAGTESPGSGEPHTIGASSPHSDSAAPDNELVWHAYFCRSGRARLLYSASLFRDRDDSAFRQMIGRVNRLLHVRDILAFRSQGYVTYDLGGWYEGQDDEEKIRINKFKEEFGGRMTTGYNCLRPVTLKGRMYLAAKSALKR